jgi:hypothetical protein
MGLLRNYRLQDRLATPLVVMCLTSRSRSLTKQKLGEQRGFRNLLRRPNFLISLRVNIFDAAQNHFVVPEAVIRRPSDNGTFPKEKSDLVFNYETSPFAFWITRRSEPHSFPLFDTRISSLPKTPLPPSIPTDNSTAFNGFPLVFEDKYLQASNLEYLSSRIVLTILNRS